MRPLALAAAAATVVVSALACDGGESSPAPAAVTGPTVFFVQIET